MQRLLTEEEYQNLLAGARSKKDVEKRDAVLAKCFELLRPDYCGKTYCDECPIRNLGRGSWDDHPKKHLLCNKSQEYSK